MLKVPFALVCDHPGPHESPLHSSHLFVTLPVSIGCIMHNTDSSIYFIKMTALALYSSDIVYYQRFHAAGFYIGYPNKEKYRIWVSGVVQSDLHEIDKLGTDYNGLATDLLKLLFKREMLTPDNCCCTQS